MAETRIQSLRESAVIILGAVLILTIVAFGAVAILGLMVFYALLVSAVAALLIQDLGFFELLQGNITSFETITGFDLPLWFYGFALIVYSPLFLAAMVMTRYNSSNASSDET